MKTVNQSNSQSILVCNFFTSKHYLSRWENLYRGQYPFQPIKFVNLVVPSPCEKEPYNNFLHLSIILDPFTCTNFLIQDAWRTYWPQNNLDHGPRSQETWERDDLKVKKRARETKTEREGEAEIKLSWPHKQGNYIISHCKLRATFI